jgi:hypothetical protein
MHTVGARTGEMKNRLQKTPNRVLYENENHLHCPLDFIPMINHKHVITLPKSRGGLSLQESCSYSPGML